MAKIPERNFREKVEYIVDRYPEVIESLYGHLMYGASQPGRSEDNWLTPRAEKLSRKENTASLFRHVGAIATGIDLDLDSNRLHWDAIICRGVMGLVRHKRGILHPEDQLKKVMGCHPHRYQQTAEHLGDNCPTLQEALEKRQERLDNKKDTK